MSRGPVRRRWRPLVAVVLGNAVVQALTVLPAGVPGATVLFVVLFVVSYVGLVAALALIASGVSAPGPVRSLPAPSIRQWIAAALAPWVVAAAGLLGPFAVPVAVPVATVLLAGAGPAATGPRRPRSAHPVAVALTALATVVIAAAGMVLALLLGFFVTGFWAALLTWVCFGAAGVGLVRWWSVLLTARASD